MQDVERIDGLVEERSRLHLGFLTHYAFNNPDALNDEMQQFRERAGLTIGREESVQLANETVEGLKRAQAAIEAAREKASGH